ncbi:Zinc finger protein ZAT4 [Linum perenne]
MITSINSEKKKSSSSDRVHECLICFKGFPSGQALGGHKRSHLLETSASTSTSTRVPADGKIPGMEDFLVDLNLPAKVDEERNSTIVNNQWWTGSKHK